MPLFSAKADAPCRVDVHEGGAAWTRGAVCIALLFAATVAQAAITVNKAFTPATVTVGDVSTATITLGNTGATAATGASFTDNLPSGLVLASPSNATTTCGGSVTASAGSGTIALSGGTIPANGGSCTVTASVTSSTASNYTNTIPVGAVTSSQGSNGSAAAATLAMTAVQTVTITGSYTPLGTWLRGNGSPVTFTVNLSNPNTIALTNVGLAIPIQSPTQAVATPSNLNSTCGPVTFSATAATLSGGTIAPGGCSIAFDLIEAQPNTYYEYYSYNSIPAGSLTSAQGATNSYFPAYTWTVAGGKLDKAFTPSTITSGDVTTLTITATNFNAASVSGVGFIDSLPAGLTVAASPNVSNTCGGTVTAVPGASSIQLAGGTIAASPSVGTTSSTCVISVSLLGTNTGAGAVTVTNNIASSTPSNTWNGVSYRGAYPVNLTINPFGIYGTKDIGTTVTLPYGVALYAGDRVPVTVTLYNSTPVPATITSFTDDLTSMGGSGWFTIGSSPAASTTCGGTVIAPLGGTVVSMTSGTIPARSAGGAPGSCTITFALQTAPNTPGSPASDGVSGALWYYNTVAANAVQTSIGNNGAAFKGAVDVLRPFGVQANFTRSTVAAGGISRLTITLWNKQNTSTFSNITTPITITLPSGLVIAPVPNSSTTCTNGVGSATAGGTTLTISSESIAPLATCEFDVDVLVPTGTPNGTFVLGIPPGSVSNDQGALNYRTLDGSLVVSNISLNLNKAFSPATVAVGVASQLQVQILNTNPGSFVLTNAGLTDNLPVGMAVASPAGASFTGSGCTGATVSAVPGASTVTVSGATIAVASTCTLKVNVVGTAAGNLINTLPAGAVVTREAVTNVAATTATLQVTGTANLAITKDDGRTSVPTGTSTTYTLVVTNAGPNNVIGATVADAPPGGMTFTSWNCSASAGASCGVASGTGAINDTININVGSTITYTVTAQIAPNFSGGSITNTATVTPPGIVADPNPANNTASDTDTVVPGVVLALTKDDGSATYTPGGTATYTVTLKNTGPANATQVNVSDVLPGGVTLSGNVVCTPTGTAMCGTVAGGAGQTSFGATGATVPSGASNALTFTAPVAFAANLTIDPLTNTVNATDVPSGATGSASDSDTRSASANVSIVKSGPSSIVAGAPISYALVIGNSGPSDANGTTFNDAVPASITGVGATCGGATGGAVCPASVNVAGNTVSGSVPTLPVGGSVTITVTGSTAAGNGATLSNTATVSPPSGTTDPMSSNNTSTATTTIKPVLAITKTADTTTLVPGGAVNYTITVSNAGPVAAPGTLVTDPVAGGIANQTWTCVGAGGATCTASGSGAINDTLTAFPAGSSVTYTVTATISGSPPPNVMNTASAALPNAVCAPADTASPCSATASLPPVPQVGISKSADTMTVTPGGTIHYTVVVSNTGVMPANNTPVSDPLPTGIASQTWTCTPSGGATCTASGSGAIADTLAAFPAGSFATYAVTATVAATPPAVISNTATASPAAGTLCTPANTAPPCTATANVTSNPQVSIAKSADASATEPGGTIHYTITVTNTGPVAADGTTVADPIPTGIASQTWTCAANAGANCTTSGTGAISDTLTAFPAGSFVTYTVTAIVANSAPAQIDNTATATPPPGGICTPGNTPAPCTATASVASVPQLSITKTADVTTLTPGGTITYTVVVSNTGPVAADGTPVSDAVPAGIASQTWTCSGSGGATCSASGSGAISDSIGTFPPGSFVTYTISATVAASPPAYVSNTVTATPPAGGVCAPANTPGPCTATATVSPRAQVSIAKTADVATVTPNGSIHYTVTVSNTGAVSADGTTVSDAVPAGIASQTWTCVPSGGATCVASGTGAINDTIATFPPGSYAVYTITASVSAAPPANLSNTATATPQDGVCTPTNTPPPCSATASVPPVPQIAITKTADTNTATPNGTITYTVVVSNAGAISADGTTVSDAVPTGIQNQSWTCTPSAGATCTASGTGTLSDTLVTFPPGSFATYTITATVSANPPAALSNTASASPPAGGVCAPGNSAPPCTSTVTAQPVPRIDLIKTADATIRPPGSTVHYTVTVSNAGTAPADGTSVSDPLPVGIASQTWTCTGAGGATCAGSGSGAIADTLAAFPAGSSATYTITATLGANPPSQITNTANATPPNNGLCAPSNAPPCVASATVQVAPVIGITKTADTSTIVASGTVTYTVTVSNAGSVAADGTAISDPVPTGIANQTWICTGSGGATCGASGSGALNDVISPFPPGSTATYTIVAQVSATPPASISNTASATPPTGGVCAPGNTAAPCAASVTISSLPQIGITKTADANQVQAGGTLHYTVTVTNAGSADAAGTTVSDPIAAGVQSQTWTCVPSGGATCAASGNGAISDTLTTFPAGGSAVYTVTATVSGAPPASIVNTASATPPSGGQCAPGATAPPCTASVVTPTSTPLPQLQISKTANTNSLQPNGTAIYTITVRNAGTVAVTNAAVSDALPAGIAAFAWTCTATGATCPHPSGSGALNEIVLTIPAGGVLTYTVTATVTGAPPASITNTASVSSSAQATCIPSGTPAPCSAAATATVQAAPPPGAATPVPTLSPWLLCMLALMMTAAGIAMTRRTP